MKLKIDDRLVIVNILPKEGDITKVRAVKELIGKVGLTAKELKNWKVIAKPGGQIEWDATKAKEVDIPISEYDKKLIADTFKEVSKNNKLTVGQIKLYDAFCKGGD